jgi:cytochrome c oxidase cbb3-type subunit III
MMQLARAARRPGCRRLALTVACCVSTLVVAACEREARPFQDLSAASARTQKPLLSELYPGGQAPPAPENSPYQNNAYGISEGKRLYENFNCVGCHSHGGGGMGPALLDEKWIYGSHPANIFETIVEGRPNGMPAFRGKIPDNQVWQIVAYVQSMSGNAALDALPGRSDHMRYSTPENARRAQVPIQTGAR